MNDPTQMEKSKIHWISSVAIGLLIGLVAIAIVVVMGNSGHRHPGERKVVSLMHAYALESAVNNFYTEYGDLPHVGKQVTTDIPDGVRLLKILLGLERDAGKHENLRDIKFLSVKLGRDKRNGLLYTSSGTSVEGLYDPWGNPYTVVLDVGFDEHLQFNYGAKPVELQGRRAAIYSPGQDKKAGTGDDIQTW